MRKIIIIACLIGSFILFLQSTGIEESILLFLMAGIIPGTNIRISSTDMLVATTLFSALIIIFAIVAKIVRYISIDRMARSEYTVTKNGHVRRRAIRV
jgi:hypothetical protein